LPDSACDVATERGHLQMLRYLREDAKCSCSAHTSAMAAHKGKLDCLQYLVDAGLAGPVVCFGAVSGGHIECCQLHRSMVTTAIEKNQYDCFVYCHENGCAWPPYTLRDCVRHGRTDMFKYGIEHGCYIVPDIACFSTSEAGLEMLTYRQAHGIPLTTETICTAASVGQLDIVIYGREQGCAWDSSVCYHAARSGILNCLEYAVQNGCPYDLRTLQDAAREGGCAEVVQFTNNLPEYTGSGEA
jgi:hypothetical protein